MEKVKQHGALQFWTVRLQGLLLTPAANIDRTWLRQNSMELERSGKFKRDRT